MDHGRGLCVWTLLLVGPLVAEAGERLVLVRDGRPTATIVTAEQPTWSARFAARELRYHVQKMTGAVLPMATDADPVRGARVLVGASRATRRLGLSNDSFKHQEYLIRFLPDTLVLMGRDAPEPAPSPVRVHGELKRVEGRFGRALEFDGSSAVTVPYCGFSDEAGTMEAWVWLPRKPQDREATLLRLDGHGPWTYHILRRLTKTSRIMYVTYDGKTGSSVTSKPLKQGWHHVLATHDAKTGRIELYIDGISCGRANYNKTTCKGTTLHIGGIGHSPGDRRALGNPLIGRIDEVRVCTVVHRPEVTRPYRAEAHTTLLLHFDEAQGDPQDAGGSTRPMNPPGEFMEQGTCYAVYDFLERHGDVRWYGPGELGMVHPTMKTLAVSGTDVRRRPVLLFRQGWPPGGYGIGRTLWAGADGREMAVFWRRLREGGQKYSCNHSFYGYYDRYWKKNSNRPDLFEAPHPEYFAQGYGGKPPQMCFTNPGFIRQVIQDARDYFDGKGTKPGARAAGDYFGLVPMDNGRYCKCATCQAQMIPDEASKGHFTRGDASDYVFGFANKVARAIKQTHPGKYLSTIAYHDYAYYPQRTRLESNISVQLCLHVRNWWAPAMERNDMKCYRSWVEREKDRPIYLWLYYCFPEEIASGRGWHCFPGFFAHTAARQIKMFARDGIRGAFLNGLGEQVDTYVTFKLFDDPTIDVDTLLDEFFTRYYGAAAEPMKRLYLRIEQIYSTPANYPKDVRTEDRHFHQTEEMAWRYLGTAKRMAELGALMEQARQAARTPIEKQRVALFDKGVWQYMVEGRRKYLAKKALAPEREKLKSQAPPQVRVPRAPSAGGDPAKVDWGKARVLDRWYTVDGYSVKRQVEARVLHDGTHLYVELQEALDTKTLASAGDVWSRDDWEVFFAPARARPYHQFGIAPNGKFRTLAYGTKEWDSGVRAVSDKSGGKRWRVRLAFRLDRLIPGGVKPGGTFYANFYRGSRTTASLAWSPNFNRNFHELSRLGEFTLE